MRKKITVKFLTASLICIMVTLSIGVAAFAANKTATADDVVPTVWDGSVASSFSGGNGSIDNPYQISNGAELAFLAQEINAGNTGLNASTVYYELTADIVLNNLTNFNVWSEGYTPKNHWTAIGKDATNCRFQANFDGNNKTVSGIYINKPSGKNQGLFGCVGRGSISNVGVTKSYVKGYDNIGGVVGYVYGMGGNILNCYNTGNVTGTTKVGGVAGYVAGSEVVNSYNTGTVKGDGNSVGGVAGYIDSSTITSNYNTGSVKGANNVGGVAGYATGIYDSFSIINNYNTGKVEGATNVGGVVGNSFFGKIVNSYNAGSVSGTSEVGGVIGNRQDGTVENCYFLTGKITIGNTLQDSTQEQAIANGTTPATVLVFDNSGVLGGNVSFTINFKSFTTTDLLTALNLWVYNNKATRPKIKCFCDTGTDLSTAGAIKYAFTESECYIVTFNLNGGGAATDNLLLEGKITKPSDPTRAGYVFGGWWTGTSGLNLTAEWNFDNQVLSQNITLYAKWTELPKTYVYSIIRANSQYIVMGQRTDNSEYQLYKNLSIAGAITAISTDANGNDCEITFGDEADLDIASSSISFASGWGTITLRGKIMGCVKTEGNNGLINFSDSVTVISYADIYNSHSDSEKGVSAIFISGEDTSLTVKSGNIKAEGNSTFSTIVNGATNLKGGKLTVEGGSVVAVLRVATDENNQSIAIINDNGGTLTINGVAKISADSYGVNNASGVLNICGNAEITAKDVAVLISAGNLDISGGTVTATGDGGIAVEGVGGTINISGGTVTADTGIAINSVGGTVVLGGNPTINGTIIFDAGNLSADSTFSPSGEKKYGIELSDPANNAVAVAGTTSLKNFLDNFELTNTGYCLVTGSGVNANNLIIKTEHTVSFDIQDGDSSTQPANIYVADGFNITAPAAPIKTGYVFGGWWTGTSGLNLTAEWNFDTDTVTADITLYAKWLQKTYEYVITGSDGSFTATGKYDDGTTYTADVAGQSIVSITGVIFKDAGSNDITVQFGDGGMLDIDASTIRFPGPNWGVITLKGKIKGSGDSVIALFNGNTVISYADISSTSTGTAGTVIACAISVGSSASLTIKDGTVSAADVAINSVGGTVVLGGDPTINGTIIFDAGNLSVDSTFSPSGEKKYGIELSDPTNNAVAVAGANSLEGLLTRFVISNSDYVLRASENNIVIRTLFSVDVNDDSNFTFIGSSKAVINENYAFELDFAEGYELDSLTVKVGESTKPYTFAGGEYTVAAGDVTGEIEITVTAKLKQYSVIFDLNSGAGTAPVTQTVLHGHKILTAPTGNWTKEGYNHNNVWHIGSATGDVFVFGTTTVTGNITLYLEWTVATVSIDTTTLPEGSYNVAYSQSLIVSGGAGGTLTYSLKSGAGSLPDGLSLNPSTGVISGTPTVANLNGFTFTVRVTVAESGEYNEQQFTIIIAKKSIDELTFTVNESFTYDGTAKTLEATEISGLFAGIPVTFTIVSHSNNINAGINTASVTISGTGNFTGERTINFSIAKKQITKPTYTESGFVYDGTQKTANISSNSAYTVTENVKTNADDYTAVVSLKDTANYEWVDGTDGDIEIEWSIAKRAITVTPDKGQSKTTGQADPTFTYTVTAGSLVNGDSLSGSLSREGGEVAEQYNITIGSLSNPNYDITFTANVKFTVIAVFTVSFASNGNGTVTAVLDGVAIPSGTSIIKGKNIVLTAVPAQGYRIKAWTLNGISVGNTPWLNVNNISADAVVSVQFEEVPTIVPEPDFTYEVSGGVIDSQDQVVQGAVVVIVSGTVFYGTALTDEFGSFSFSGLPNNKYNVIALKDGKTVTVEVIVRDNNLSITIKIPDLNISSKLEIKEGAPDIVVGSLDEVAVDAHHLTEEDVALINDGGSAELKLSVEKIESSEITVDSSKTIGFTVEITITSTVTDKNGNSTYSNVSTLGRRVSITIPLDESVQGMKNYVVYRMHNGEQQVITQIANLDGEYFELTADGKYIILYVCNFSQYAVGFDLPDASVSDPNINWLFYLTGCALGAAAWVVLWRLVLRKRFFSEAN